MIAGAMDMIAGDMGMTAPALALTGLYAALVLMLLSLHLKSGWSWSVKSLAIGLALPATVGAFHAVQAQLGWPSQDTLPARFQLHAALIEEPAIGEDDGGAIFLWLTPWADDQGNDEAARDTRPRDDAGMDGAMLPRNRRPRAFDLPYTRKLHQEVEAMRERLARGEMVTGRHESGKGWERRFGQQGGQIDLEAPPPPPLPSKDG